MSTVQEIEQAIQRLPERDVVALTQWLDEYAEQQWDRRLASDAAAGNLASLVNEARAARQNKTRRPFP
jgi:t-SNARE complex subunit (syntaxin)